MLRENKIASTLIIKIPKRYKRNAIFGDHQWVKSTSTNFYAEASYIINKVLKADYPLRFFKIILFLLKFYFLIEIRIKSKDFTQNVHEFTNTKFKA